MSIFNNSSLEQEVIELRAKLALRDETLKKLEAKLNDIAVDEDAIKLKDATIAERDKRIAELEANKTEAELFLVSVKICATILRGETPKNDDLAKQRELRNAGLNLAGTPLHPAATFGNVGRLERLATLIG